MVILVSGVAGFIGYHLAKALCNMGHNVIGIDNLNNYYSVEYKQDRLNQLNFKNFSFIKCDICNIEHLKEVFDNNKINIVCNLAAQAGVRYSFENPFSYIQSNIVGFTNILEISRIHNIEHFIYASSSSVYGNNNKIPFSESDFVDNPQSIYAATKKSDELIAYVYSKQYKMQTSGLRFFTVYGPWGRPDMAPFIFLKAILNAEAIKVFNNGNLSRDFSYIDDITNGILKLINTKNREETYKIYNIGKGSPIKLMDFIKTIEKVSKKKAIIEFEPMQRGDVYTTYADTSLIEKELLFKPSTNLEDGIEYFYKWFKEYSLKKIFKKL